MPIDADDFAPPRDSTAIVDEAAQRPRVGLRLIAMFEALKGLVVVAAGFGLLSLLHRNVQAMAEALLRHSHLNPASRTPQIFLALAARITAADLWLLALGAAAYASLRFIEAYGLWRDRTWASWLGALSGAIYLPIELFEVVEHASLARLALLLANAAIVAYLGVRLWKRRQT